MVRVSSAYVAKTAIDGVMSARSQMVLMYQQIASGKKIQKASDDPVQSARILDLQSQISDIEQASRYVTIAKNDLAIEEAVLSSSQDVVLRARSLLLSGANGATSDKNREVIANEVDQLLEQVFSFSNSKNPDGAYISSGYLGDVQAFAETRNGAGRITAVSYNGDNNTVEKTVTPELRVKISHPGSELFDNGVDSLFNALIVARDEMLAGNIPTTLPELDQAYDMLTNGMTEVGARTNQVEAASQINSVLSLTMQSTLGEIRDLDLPVAITQFTQLEVAVQAINNTFAKIAQTSLFKYL
jgi:flagellar hook-associated protein 3 FlgL